MTIDWTRHSGSKFLNGETVDQPVNLTIAGVEERLLGQGDDQQLRVVVTVHEDDRALALNRTRQDALRELMGDDTDAWLGRRFRLVPGVTHFSGKKVKTVFVEAAGEGPF